MLEDNPTPDIEGWVRSTPEFIEVPAADGETMLQVSLTKPPGFDPGRPHPVIVYGYGGPHGHVVADRWRHNNIWGQFLAQNGYVVMSVDPRGSNYRGKAFEDAIWQKFSKVEIEDTAAVVRHMREEVWFDGENVGIWGWSYGGTLVIGSLLDTRNVYRCGAAVAPVTRWQWYDTHYTERYLGMPDDNPEVYTRANLLERDPAGLDERLLIVHGMADDNVFPRHSLALVSRLQDAGVQFDLMLYPGKTHLIAGKQTRAHLYGMMFAFFEKHLR